MGSLHDKIISYFVASVYVEKHLKYVGTVMKAKGILVWGRKKPLSLLWFLSSYEDLIKKKKRPIPTDIPVKLLLTSRVSRLITVGCEILWSAFFFKLTVAGSKTA